MSLDTATLLTVATCVTGLLGVFILVCWVQERGTRALAWWGAAYLMGGSAVGLWGAQDLSSPLLQAVPNALLFIACGMIWNGARLFHGLPVRPLAMLAGAFAWIAAMQFQVFAASDHDRIILSSLIIATYTFLTSLELRRERRRSRAWFATIVPLLHGIVFLSPIPLSLLIPEGAWSQGWFALFGLQTLLYVVGTAFIVVIMTKERVLLGHKTAAMTDPLTGVFNRRALLDAGRELMMKQARSRGQVSVLLFDLDHFKSINDRFGHAVGDEAIRLFASTARGNIRATDILARLGGEEFAVMMPGGAPEAAMVAERLRAAFEKAAVEIASHPIGATVSVGVAWAPAPVGIDDLVDRADVALYVAKANGRNRVERAVTDDAREVAPADSSTNADVIAAMLRWIPAPLARVRAAISRSP